MTHDSDTGKDEAEPPPKLSSSTLAELTLKDILLIIATVASIVWGVSEKWNTAKDAAKDATSAQTQASKEFARLDGTVTGQQQRLDQISRDLGQLTFRFDQYLQSKGPEEERWRQEQDRRYTDLERRTGEVREWWLQYRRDVESSSKQPLRSASRPQ